MKKQPILTCASLLLATAFGGSSFAQSSTAPAPIAPPYRATPAHMWELGVHGGITATLADIDFEPNWGAGFHLRRAIDYVFSVRGEGLLGALKFNDQEDGTAETKFQSGSLHLVASLNNLVWNNRPKRRTNVYVFVGGGITRFEVVAKSILGTDLRSYDPTVQTNADIGLGIAFRLSDRFNLAFESKGQVIFGNDADLLDGVAREQNDVLTYFNTRLNFNLGNKHRKVEPLYWVNPMDAIMQDITELKNRPKFDFTDTDGDGVIDLIDQDNTTPPDIAVDTRGLPLDSDGDGIPNFEDEEPYLPKGSKVVTRQPGEKPFTTEDDVTKIVEGELSKFESESLALGGGSITNWFLPIIHFSIDSDKIRYADYGSLSSIAKVMKSNPDIRVAVTGFTDKTASADYNSSLSFRRAKAAIDHLVNTHGISRSRLVLNFNGEDDPLVPSAGSSLMNRRVEFRVATPEDVDMELPVPVSRKAGKTQIKE